jgi:hypothetical protein
MLLHELYVVWSILIYCKHFYTIIQFWLATLKTICHVTYGMIHTEDWRNWSKVNRFTLGRVDAEMNRDRRYLLSFSSQSIRLIGNFLANKGCTIVKRNYCLCVLVKFWEFYLYHHKEHITSNIHQLRNAGTWTWQTGPYTICIWLRCLPSFHELEIGKVTRDVWCDNFDP